jgi:hypothetical protein
VNAFSKRPGFAAGAAAAILLAWSSAGADAQSLEPTRSALAQGITYALSTPENVAAAVALGVGLEQLNRRGRSLALALLTAGVAVGVFLTRVDWINFDNLLLALMFLVPGAIFVAASLPLLPCSWRPKAAMAIAAPAIGTMLGFAVALEGTSTEDSISFALGAGMAAAIAGLAVAIAWHRLARSWFAIPARIVGSWILAIGIMLTAIGVQTFRTADAKDYFDNPEPTPGVSAK